MKKTLMVVLAAAMLCSPIGANVRPVNAVGIEIPTTTLKSKFGRSHAFKLKDRDNDPIFTIAGYTFKVETYGHGLYEPLYYDVPVYVALDADYGTGLYRLYTTKEIKVSVGLTVVSGPHSK